jgi:outer membrane protein assembly factor BamB
MRSFKNKATASAISIILMLAMVASLVILPTANAQVDEKVTYCFVGANPNPVGVGQDVLLHFGITDPLQDATEQWHDVTVTVERPDGDTDTLGPYSTDSTGGTGDIYVPDIAGEYVLQAHFPEQWYNYSGFNVWGMYVDSHTLYKASDSDELTLVVEEEPRPDYPNVPLPTEYWTRPIDAQIRDWYSIAGSWLYEPENRYAINNDGPETAHILWDTPLTIGGMVGGDVGLYTSINQGAVGFGTGDAYEGLWSSRFILAGRLYYATYSAGGLAMGTFPEPVEYHCVDLHTGEELWTKVFMDNATIDFAQLLYYQGFNYMGTFAYLYVTEGGYDFWTGMYLPGTWYAFNAYTGNLAFTILNVPSGTTLRDANGGLYVLHVDQMNGWMGQWNMSGFVEASATGYYSEGGSWGNVVNGMTFDAGAATPAAAEGWDFNVTIRAGLPGSVRAAYFNDRVVGASIGSEVSVWGYSIAADDVNGAAADELFDTSWNAPSGWVEGNQSISWAADSEESLVGVLWSKELRQHYGISLETGQKIWGPTDSQYYLDIYEGSMLTSHLIAYGRLYASGVAGILYCYNVTTGDLLWTYEAADTYTESPFSSNWWLGITFITDGKLYIGSAEHSANQPLPRGAPFLCVNATTGDVIWRANGLFRQTGWGGLAIIGDSIIATMDTYDQQLYAIGKGPSDISVMASPKVSVEGDNVLVEGMVTDISPGTEEYALTARFPDGVPAVCDDNMSEWMLYVYKQFAQPADVMGVDVTISVLDPNGNYYDVGTATSDASGFYKLMFTPPVPGEYTIIASFAGSEAYYGSHAETAIGVDEATPPTAPPTASPAPMTDAYVLSMGAAAVIAIVAIGLVIILMLRKR